MFSRPFVDFDPGPDDGEAAASVRRRVLAATRRAVESGAASGDPTDIAHVLVACAQGLAAAQAGGRMGHDRAAWRRRWDLAGRVLVAGLHPRAPGTVRAPAP